MNFTQREKNQLINTLESALKAARDMPAGRDCHTCANCDRRGGPARCRVADIEIPPEVIDVGCEAYIYDHTLPPF